MQKVGMISKIGDSLSHFPRDNTQLKFRYEKAKKTIDNRSAQCAKVIADCLENDMELLGLTGVEDKLQVNIAF